MDAEAFVERFLKPHYLFRPGQGLRRLRQALSHDTPGPRLACLPWGLPIHIDTREVIGLSIWQFGLYDLAVSETLWRLLRPGDLAVDVGANIGAMTGLMALRTGPAGEVLAFEPHPEVFAELLANLELFQRRYGFSPVLPCHAALGREPGTGFLHTDGEFASNRGTAHLGAGEDGLPVPVVTLDEVLAGRTAALMKLDVEGGELQVLAGAADSLRRGLIRNVVYESFAAQSQELADVLRGYGYEIYSLGRRLLGLDVATGEPRIPPYEPPSALATRDPEALLRL
ncbi:MAG TPA: FkbM family methyltransferase, partial [Thermoanaerobaculia bacterium]|nr:FkbM family methyltransferase [Thermoanaerobaculia bacterium]